MGVFYRPVGGDGVRPALGVDVGFLHLANVIVILGVHVFACRDGLAHHAGVRPVGEHVAVKGIGAAAALPQLSHAHVALQGEAHLQIPGAFRRFVNPMGGQDHKVVVAAQPLRAAEGDGRPVHPILTDEKLRHILRLRHGPVGHTPGIIHSQRDLGLGAYFPGHLIFQAIDRVVAEKQAGVSLGEIGTVIVAEGQALAILNAKELAGIVEIVCDLQLVEFCPIVGFVAGRRIFRQGNQRRHDAYQQRQDQQGNTNSFAVGLHAFFLLKV